MEEAAVTGENMRVLNKELSLPLSCHFLSLFSEATGEREEEREGGREQREGKRQREG